MRDVAVDVLSAPVQEDAKRLVSLVGCPGTGKTWCGWLVAHALQNKEKKTLHVTIRGKEVIVVSEFKKKKTYEVDDWKYSMLGQVLNENPCDVCIIDVGDKSPTESNDIFRGVRTILESSADPKPFPNVKFMCLVSGHAQENIIGKDRSIAAQKLVLWSWSEDDFQSYFEASQGSANQLKEHTYRICGGSVRLWFNPAQDEENISDDVEQLEEQEMQRFLTPDHRPTSNTNHHQHSRLLAFFRNPTAFANAGEDDFKRGVVSAYIVPRSDYVIRSIKAHEKGSFSQFKKMYERLLPLNPGAAGTPFEILVHYFWEECINKKDNIQLKITDQHGLEKRTIMVDCSLLKPVAECKPVESSDDKGKDAVDANLLGYFTPKNKKNYPRLDSILRYKSAEQTEVLAIQVSIGATHQYGDKRKNVLLEAGGKTSLALWDHRDKDRKCVWKSNESMEAEQRGTTGIGWWCCGGMFGSFWIYV